MLVMIPLTLGVAGYGSVWLQQRLGYGNQTPAIAVRLTKNTANLGGEFVIGYEVSHADFDQVTVQITNKDQVVIANWTGEVGTVGSHQVVWTGAVWTTGAHEGASANPNNGPYLIEAIGYKGQQEKGRSLPITRINTQLIIGVDLSDDKPSSNEISSGLYAPNFGLDGTTAEIIAVGLATQSGGRIWATQPPTFSDIERADLDNDAKEEIKKVHVRQVFQSNVPDGTYHVVIDKLRDQAGNKGVDGSSAGVCLDWNFTLY
jgi:hypothetical protein